MSRHLKTQNRPLSFVELYIDSSFPQFLQKVIRPPEDETVDSAGEGAGHVGWHVIRERALFRLQVKALKNGPVHGQIGLQHAFEGGNDQSVKVFAAGDLPPVPAVPF